MLKESELQVLNYLTLHPDGAGFVSQIGRAIGMSKGEVSKAVKVLKHGGLVRAELSGRNMICSIDRRLPMVSRLRGTFNLLEIVPKVEALRQCADKVVLFGSCAEGTDTLNSDIDLLVITRDKVKANKAAQKIKLSRPVQWVIKTPQEYVVLNSKEPVFAKELGRGIVLWEVYETARV
jgi:predicted nucleotidyltransferase